MTSLSSLSSLLSTQQTPRSRMDARIAAAASAGEISTTDQTALGKALDSIDSSLASSATGGLSSSSGDMKAKMDSLIDAQVSSGTLTDAQASELRSFFGPGPQGGPQQDGGSDTGDGSSAQAAGGIQGAGATGHAHHLRGAGGPPPPPPSDDADNDGSDASGDSSATATASTTSSTGSSIDDQLKALESFLDNLRQSLTSTTTYGAGSTASSGAVFSGIA